MDKYDGYATPDLPDYHRLGVTDQSYGASLK